MLRYPLVAGDGRTMVEEVDVSPPPSLPPSQLALVQVCDNFAVSELDYNGASMDGLLGYKY